MPYETGVVNTNEQLRDAIVTFAQANSWTWDAASEILDNGQCFVGLIYNDTSSGNSDVGVYVNIANGKSGGALVDNAPHRAGITQRAGTYNTSLTYPATYHFFINPENTTITCGVNYGTFYWQWLGFGTAITYGITGTGNFHWGSVRDVGSNFGVSIGPALHVSGTDYTSDRFPDFSAPVPFWTSSNSEGSYCQNSYIHLDLDSIGWYRNSLGSSFTTDAGVCDSSLLAQRLLRTQPNDWNLEASLMPVNLLASRPSSFYSGVGRIPSMRFTRMDYFTDGQILDIGGDKWFIAPAYRKDLNSRDGFVPKSFSAANSCSTGTFALAIRYDGP